MNTEVVVVENPVDGVAKVIKNAKVSFANCNPKIGDGGCGELSLSLKKAKTVFLNLADQGKVSKINAARGICDFVCLFLTRNLRN